MGKSLNYWNKSWATTFKQHFLEDDGRTPACSPDLARDNEVIVEVSVRPLITGLDKCSARATQPVICATRHQR